MTSNSLPAAGDVLSAIKDLSHQDTAIELSKTFRGLVLQQDVKILEVNPHEAAFEITSPEMSPALEGEIYLNSQLLPKPVMARFKSLDLRNCRLVLSHFAYVDSELKNRQHERVRPKQPTYVTLHWKRREHRACVENLSINGMGILAFKMFERGMRIQPGSKVQLEFQLSRNQVNMALKGMIIYINNIDQYLTTIGIQLFPTGVEARLLKEYITPRKQEIFEELNKAYWELIRPRGVETLYF